MTSNRTLVGAALTAAALALAGCSDSGSDPATTTAAPTSTTQVTVTSSDASSVSTTAPTTSAATTEQTEPTEQTAQTEQTGNTTQRQGQELQYGDVGTPVTVNGEDATVCIYGDGWGTNVWAGNAHASCEFVSAVYDRLTEGLNATEDNIRDHLPSSIEVTSPVTGQTYELGCARQDQQVVACYGGEDAVIYIY